jgi:hypothetical protein
VVIEIRVDDSLVQIDNIFHRQSFNRSISSHLFKLCAADTERATVSIDSICTNCFPAGAELLAALRAARCQSFLSACNLSDWPEVRFLRLLAQIDALGIRRPRRRKPPP